MTNYASNRLIIAGPADELTRFLNEHVFVTPGSEVDDPALDFASIIRVPPEITATMSVYSRENRDAARKATGYEDMDDWAMKVWGTSREPQGFNGRLFGDALYDCRFDTAWGSPCGIVKTLAQRYPSLRGTLASSESGMDWCVIRDFADGESWYVSTDYDNRVARLIGAGWTNGPRRKVTAQATLDSLEALRAPHGPTYSRRPFDRDAAGKAMELRLERFYGAMENLGASRFITRLRVKRS
ncbi:MULTISPECIES: hypothetical protein [unclassified Methylobacterium]|uniref:hypothetical protein n=1 Tax=unclassified Methylobacterium TaxID=2615210 RepID=UPI00226A2AC3|nr:MULTISPECIES: hypothetical protein [unclassified Methylobacterium]